MKPILSLLVLIVSVLLRVTSVDAQEVGHEKWFATIAVGQSLYSGEDELFNDGALAGRHVDTDSIASEVSLGYEIGKRVALEIGYTHLGETDFFATAINSTRYPSGKINLEIELQGVLAGLSYRVPIARQQQLYIRAGVFGWQANAELTTTAGRDSDKSRGNDAYVSAALSTRMGSLELQFSYGRFFVDDGYHVIAVGLRTAW